MIPKEASTEQEEVQMTLGPQCWLEVWDRKRRQAGWMSGHGDKRMPDYPIGEILTKLVYLLNFWLMFPWWRQT